MAGFGHAISEVGAATIVGGNIHGQTQVMTTSIVEHVGKGDFNEALVYAAILLGARVRDQRRAHVGAAARGLVGAVLSLRDVRHRRGERDVLAIDGLTCERASDLPCSVQMAPARRPCSGSRRARQTQHLEAWRSTARRSRAPIWSLRRRIGYATQRPGLLSTSVIRNVELPLRWRGSTGRPGMRAAHAALERLSVAELAEPQGALALGWRSAAGQPRTRPRGRPGVIAARRAGSRPRRRGAPSVLRRSRTGSERPRDDGRARVAPRRGGAAPGRPNRGSLRRDSPADRRAGLGRATPGGRERGATGRLRKRPAGARRRLGTGPGRRNQERSHRDHWRRSGDARGLGTSHPRNTVRCLTAPGDGRTPVTGARPVGPDPDWSRNAVRPSAPRREATTGR